MSESATPESGALSVEQAIAALAPEPVEQEAPEAQAAPEPVENTEGETSAPEEAEDGAETPAEEAEAEAEPEAVAPAEPPKYWSQDAKVRFAELDPEMQAVVLSQEGPREEAAAKAKAEAAESTQRAQAEVAKVAQLAEALSERLPQWVANFKDQRTAFLEQWGGVEPDWDLYEAQHGEQAATAAERQYRRDKSRLETAEQNLTEAAQVQQIAATQALQAQVQAELAKLADVAPDLVDPVEGPKKRDEIGRYLAQQGIPAEAAQRISATELVLARKAMLWDQAQAQLKAAPKPKPAVPTPKAPVRPAAAVAQSPTQRTAQQVANRFAQTRSVDDAVALLLARKG